MMASKAKRKWFFFSGLVVYLAIVFILSHIPGSTWSNLGFSFWDKAAHFIEFVPIGFLLVGWLFNRNDPAEGCRRNTFVLVCCAIVGVAATDEVHQLFVPGRQASLGDFLADILGGISGAIACAVVFHVTAIRSQSETTL